MKIKKSKFAKLLTLALPITAISIVTPVVLTSCGSSTSNGDSSGDNTQTYDASWDTSKTQEGLTFDTTNNSSSAVITLNDSVFASTGISKKSTFDQIKQSLDPSTTGSSLYSVLSGAIKDINNYTVSLSINTNPVVFDYTNDSVGNYFDGQFVLTPKKSGESTVNLKFRVNNFNDSYNGNVNDTTKQLKWNIDKIQETFKSDTSSTGNLPDVKPQDNGASVTINLAGQKFGENNQQIGLGHVMDELCNTTITGEELNSFITGDTADYNVSSAKISTWAPTVDSKMVFTRIVIPNKDTSKQDAIMYIAYTGFSIDKDDGNAAWNRNIPYIGSTNLSDNLTDGTEWKEPVIDLSKIDGDIGGSGISKNSTSDDITKEENKNNLDKVVEFVKDNYIIDGDNFTVCFTGDKTSTTPDILVGKFNASGIFEKNSSTDSQNLSEKAGGNDAASSNNPLNGKEAVQLKIFFQPKNGTSAALYNQGIWRSFFLVGYKTSK